MMRSISVALNPRRVLGTDVPTRPKLHRLCEKFDLKDDDVLAALADPSLPCPTA